MFLGEDLEVEAPVSERLLKSMDTVQDIFLNWYPAQLQRIKVRANAQSAVAGRGDEKVACFFSGGVDAWYSFLKNRNRIGLLLTVKGFDIPVYDEAVWPDLLKANQRIAAECGVPLLHVETNLRQCIDPSRPGLGKQFRGNFWGNYLHGAFLGAVGLCLQQQWGTLIIPSSYPYISLHPWGSHPLVDRLWSNEVTEFVHDGSEANRMDKVRAIARANESLPVLRQLRVCPDHTPMRYNCGRCEKCVRTMLALHLFKVLEKTPSFDVPLDLRTVSKMRIQPHKYVWYEEILAEALAQKNEEVARLCRVLMRQERSFYREWSHFYEAAQTRTKPWAEAWTQHVNPPVLRFCRRWKRSFQKRANWVRSLSQVGPET
ncbi:MAG TPA: hypothetical protein VN673_06520 [Clostridia bacterium]|nr:hypothetical protein [Clostridia bacterium]